ncbi:MAG: hypothetical protein IJI48_02625, partial [Ruminococcus sp.]|nr:hypothetical protein [Ruminococcus sp.]
VQKAGELTGKPIMIGEFHFGAPDAGMLAAAICSVATQEACRNYQLPTFVYSVELAVNNY